MMKNIYIILLSFLCLTTTFAQDITGVVVDQNGKNLIGARVFLKGTVTGAITDMDGTFNIPYKGTYPIVLTVLQMGYAKKEVEVQRANDSIKIELMEGMMIEQEIVISASRKSEFLLETPAAVSMLVEKDIAASGGAISPIRALINTPGVELQQQTGQRINLALRGSNSLFSTTVFPMLDHRSLISPGLEFFDSQNSPINNIDIERVEVVLGPVSALYGPDVTSGVVHFVSKDPFQYPGTTTELIYGEMNTFKAAIRHAGYSKNGKLGYKINARYGSGDDFTLQPGDPEDDAVLANFQDTIRRGYVTEREFINPQENGPALLAVEKSQIPEYTSAAVNGHLYFRPNRQTQIVASGGWNAGSAIFYNELGEGYASSNEVWGQVRFRNKGFFAQTYYIKNDGGSDTDPVYLNRTGLIVPLERMHFEAQAQYNFKTTTLLDVEWTIGMDQRTATSNTENHVYGRNERKDDYRIFGGYLQSKMKLGKKFDLFLAGRYDLYNFTDEKTFSPRIALIYKPNEFNTLRLSYNRAANPIPASEIYFDLPVQTNSAFNVWNMGGINPQTFENPMITWLIPGVSETSFDDGFLLADAYNAVNASVIAEIEALGTQDPDLAPLIPTLVQLLQSDVPEGYSSGILSTDLNGNELLPISSSTKLISHLTALEVGYKGLFWDKLVFGLDAYYFSRTNAGGFSQVSPIITMTSLPTDLGTGVQTSFEPKIAFALEQQGMSPEMAAATAAQIGGILNTAYASAGQQYLDGLSAAGLSFHGIVESDQVPETDVPNLAYGYPTRNPNEVTNDWGFEAYGKYYISNVLTSFFNYTWFNRPTGLPGDLNFPQNKIRLGVNYSPRSGLNGSLSYQWDQAYTSNNAIYVGKIDAKSLVDASVSYIFKNGLTAEISATNLFNNEFRALPGLPKIGRRIIGRLVYDINGR